MLSNCYRRIAWLMALMMLCAGAASVRAEQSEDYRIGPEDVVKISVFDHPELSVEARVSKSGNITFPLLGVVKVADSSARKVEENLVQRLESGGYVRRPQVSVLISEYQSQKVSVMGQVLKPGQYALTKSSRLMDLLAQAGGVVNATAA